MDYLSITLSITAVLIAIYYFLIKDLNYFKKHGIIHTPAIPILGNIAPFMFRKTSFAHLTQKIYNIHPEAKYVGFFDLMNPVVVIRDPELIKSIGVKHFESFMDHRSFVDEKQDPLFAKNLFSLRGERWKDIRNLLSPAFTSSKMKSMFVLTNNCAAEFASFLSTLPKDKSVVELMEIFTRYTTDVIATCAFGITVDSMRNPTNEFYVYGQEATNFHGFIRTVKFFISRGFPRITRLLGIQLFGDHISRFFKDIVSSTMKTRDEKGIYRPDMIQLMMESRGKRGPGRELTIDDMTAQAFIFFFGGFDTVSRMMCFVAYELAVNPDIHARLQDEVDKAFDATNGQLTYEAVVGMEFLDAVINEALRKYPIAIFVDRLCTNDFDLPPALPGDKPLSIKKGMNVWFPVYGLHHDPQYFEDPDTFKPERFLGDGKKLLNAPYYLPFGLGPRMCIGNRFALLEIKVVMCHLLARCNLKSCSKTANPLVLDKKGVPLLPENGFWIKFEPRENPHPSLQSPVSNGTCKA